jgi:hypothetical protein
MRTFEQIVTDAGKDEEIALALGVKKHNVRDWRLRKSIPAEHFNDFVDRNWATHRELGDAAIFFAETREARAAEKARRRSEPVAA